MKIFITGGAGFIGSHVARYYLRKGHKVTVYDNLCRSKLLKNKMASDYNWNDLARYKNCVRVKGDIKNYKYLKQCMQGHNVVFHMAAQTAVTTSMLDPRTDFMTNALGTFNVLEAARLNGIKKIIYMSTNKVYGDNVNRNIKLSENKTRYSFLRPYNYGVPTQFPIDHCVHSLYGCSKLSGDLYMQDYSRLYGMQVGVFRASCIFGTHQMGVEDQGWVAWFTIATLLGKPITIYGDGKQVRDVLYVDDLVDAFVKFLKQDKSGVFNIGGSKLHTISLIELLDMLEDITGRRSKIHYEGWRPADQEVYISDTSSAELNLCWLPQTKFNDGLIKLIDWVKVNKCLFG